MIAALELVRGDDGVLQYVYTWDVRLVVDGLPLVGPPGPPPDPEQLAELNAHLRSATINARPRDS